MVRNQLQSELVCSGGRVEGTGVLPTEAFTRDAISAHK
jgi:hypothetical protein